MTEKWKICLLYIMCDSVTDRDGKSRGYIVRMTEKRDEGIVGISESSSHQLVQTLELEFSVGGCGECRLTSWGFLSGGGGLARGMWRAGRRGDKNDNHRHFNNMQRYIVSFQAGQVWPQQRYIMTKTRRVGPVPFARQKARHRVILPDRNMFCPACTNVTNNTFRRP